MPERRKNTRERRTVHEHHYIIRVSTAMSHQEFLSRLNKEPMFYQAHIYDFGVNSSHPIREELSKLLAKTWGQEFDDPQTIEYKEGWDT